MSAADRAEQPHASGSLRHWHTLPNPSRMERDKSSTIYNYGGSETSQRNGSWPSSRSILRLVFVSVVLSFSLVLSRSPSALWPGSFLSSQTLKTLSQISLDATSQEKSLPKLIPTALSSNGRTDQVQWDNYTLILRGQRVLI
jgi:hypothetical protein